MVLTGVDTLYLLDPQQPAPVVEEPKPVGR